MCLRMDWFSSRDAGRQCSTCSASDRETIYSQAWGWSSSFGLGIRFLRFHRDGIDHLRQGGVCVV